MQRLNAIYIGDKREFNKRVFNMLVRYQSIGAMNGCGYWLARNIQGRGSLELFASPLDCRFVCNGKSEFRTNYCSPYPDTDKYFNSRARTTPSSIQNYGASEDNLLLLVRPPFILPVIQSVVDCLLGTGEGEICSMKVELLLPNWTDSDFHKTLVKGGHRGRHVSAFKDVWTGRKVSVTPRVMKYLIC